MSVLARYGTKRGGSGCRGIRSVEEAEALLKGGYGVTTVELIDGNAEPDAPPIGERFENDGRCEDRRVKWIWCYDQEWLKEALAKEQE